MTDVINQTHTQALSLQLMPLETVYLISDLRDQFIRHGYEIAEHSKDTMSTRKCHLKFFVDFCTDNGVTDIRTLTNPIIDEFYVEYRKTRAKSTVNTAKRILKVFLRWIAGYKEGITVRAKPEAIELVRVRKTNPEAIDDRIIIEVIRKVEVEQDRIMIATLRESGIRAGEIVALRVRDILYDQLQITQGKDETDRNVCITLQLANTLRQFALDNNRNGEDWLFQNVYTGYGEQMKVKTVNLRIQRCFMRIAGVQMHIHQLRHTMAIEMLRGGSDLVSIQRQLGHKDITTTQMYLRVYDEFVQAAYAKSMPKSILAY
jgi:integrase/recombinase XerD